jgi:hypothetical protein
LLREIFRSKYEDIHAICQHEELARYFTTSFGLSIEDELNNENQDSLENLERLGGLLDMVKHMKTEVDQYHTEMNNLTDHIVDKLFNSNPTLLKQTTEEEQKVKNSESETFESDEEPQDAEEYDLRHKKGIFAKGVNPPESMFGGASSDGAKNSDKSTDVTSNNNQASVDKHENSKSASFKSKLPKKATDVLKAWFLNHIPNPYPSHEDKDKLSQITGLSRKQIQNWFTNSRKRFLEPLKKVSDQKNSPTESNQDKIPQIGNKSIGSTPQLEPTILNQGKIKTPVESQPFGMNLEAPLLPQQMEFAQNQQVPPIFMPQLNMNRPMPQGLNQAVNIQSQPLFYQGYLPTNGITPNGNNIVILNPYMMAQQPIMYPYRPNMMNMMPLNAPFMQIPQGAYIVPIQQNFAGMRGMPGSQNLNSNYNTINNNIYNNLGNLPTFGSGLMNYNINPSKIVQPTESYYNLGGLNQELNCKSGLHHPKTDLNEVYQTAKAVHKDDGKDHE